MTISNFHDARAGAAEASRLSRRAASNSPTTLAHALPGSRFRGKVFNFFDEESSDIDYSYTSRLRSEPADGFDDIHTHPNELRTVRFSVTAKF